jgi:hypothetical protein
MKSPKKERGLKDVGVDPNKGHIWSDTLTEFNAVLDDGELGITTPFGDIYLSAELLSDTEVKATLIHELVHRFFTPRFFFLRRFRVQLATTGYVKFFLLRYLEEAICESVAQLRMNGMRGLLTGIKFPIANGYMSINQLRKEGMAIGIIVAEGQHFFVQFMPTQPKNL